MLYSMRLIAKDHLVTFGHKGRLIDAVTLLQDTAATAKLTGHAKIYTNGGTLVLDIEYSEGRQLY